MLSTAVGTTDKGATGPAPFISQRSEAFPPSQAFSRPQAEHSSGGGQRVGLGRALGQAGQGLAEQDQEGPCDYLSIGGIPNNGVDSLRGSFPMRMRKLSFSRSRCSRSAFHLSFRACTPPGACSGCGGGRGGGFTPPMGRPRGLFPFGLRLQRMVIPGVWQIGMEDWLGNRCARTGWRAEWTHTCMHACIDVCMHGRMDGGGRQFFHCARTALLLEHTPPKRPRNCPPVMHKRSCAGSAPTHVCNQKHSADQTHLCCERGVTLGLDGEEGRGASRGHSVCHRRRGTLTTSLINDAEPNTTTHFPKHLPLEMRYTQYMAPVCSPSPQVYVQHIGQVQKGSRETFPRSPHQLHRAHNPCCTANHIVKK